MKKVFLILTVTVLGLFLAGCSDLQTSIEQPGSLSIHKEGISKQDSPDFHGKVIRNAGWNMDACHSCHAKDYSGGTAKKSCLTCHSQTSGPEACNTCHGNFAYVNRPAPPRDLSNNTLKTFPGVGAHTAHLYENISGATVACNQCHIVPSTLKSPGHIGADGKAEIVWGDLAKLRGDGVNPNLLPVYDSTAYTCSNTYCHGYFKNGNLTNAVKWTEKADCGTCHGNATTKNPLPGGTHPQASSCQSCHSKTVQMVNGVLTVKKEFHINGINEINEVSCNSCHGNPNDPNKISPPLDLKGNTASTFPGVGAHIAHLYNNESGKVVACNQCHAVPSSIISTGHLDGDNKAELTWGDLAKLRVTGVDPNIQPVYDFTTNTCQNTYCHGYFKNGNLTNSVKWTDEAECGTCHGNTATGSPLPGGSHIQGPYFEQNCQVCHTKTVENVNGVISFKDKNLHINGVIDMN